MKKEMDKMTVIIIMHYRSMNRRFGRNKPYAPSVLSGWECGIQILERGLFYTNIISIKV